MITNKMISDSLRIAKSLAPIDSENLRYNAIRVTNRNSNGFTITYSSVDAYYIQFVEDGTEYQEAQHFIENTYINLSNYFDAIGNNDRISNIYRNSIAQDKLNKELFKDNPDYRRLVNSRSTFQYYQNQGRDTLYRKRGE